ncbi:MAG: Rieske (2Fe-2S) protein, partial [Nitrospirae bacterium]|nr:Rieske (2Fe-2S) protein [Nitrospirota bacterium]
VVFALLGLGSLFAGLRVLAPTGVRDRELAWFPLVPEEEVPRSGVRKAELVYSFAGKERKARVFIISSADKLTVLSAVCSHLGCLVNYRKETREFVCPCHGGKYDIAGKNIAGPPPIPLTAYPVEVRNGTVMVGIKV